MRSGHRACSAVNDGRGSQDFFVLRKKGSKTKERMKEEEIEKGNCGRQPEKSFFEILSDLNQAVPNHLADESLTRFS